MIAKPAMCPESNGGNAANSGSCDMQLLLHIQVETSALGFALRSFHSRTGHFVGMNYLKALTVVSCADPIILQ